MISKFFIDRPRFAFVISIVITLAGIVAVSMLTAPLGASIAHKLPVPKLKKFFACFRKKCEEFMLANVLAATRPGNRKLIKFCCKKPRRAIRWYVLKAAILLYLDAAEKS